MCATQKMYNEIEAASMAATTSTTPKQLPCNMAWVVPETLVLLKTAVVSAVNGYVLQPNPESNYQIQTKYPRINGKYQNGQR